MKLYNKKLFALTALSLALAACSGSDGSDGEPGVAGPQGEQGPAGEPGGVATPEPSEITVAGGRIAQDFLEATAGITLATTGPEAGQPLPFEEDDDDVQPGPPSVGADIPVTYFGPAPSSVNENLIGPVQLLNSGTVDQSGEVATITIPLYEGRLDVEGGDSDGQTFWYIVTDTSDRDNAAALGLNFSEKLVYSDVLDESSIPVLAI